MMPLALSGYVLAGGRSSRMGRDKALLHFDGRTLAERAVEVLAAVCERVRIVGAQPELGAFAETVQDEFAGCGPVGGLEAALRDSAHAWVMVLPVDLPFLPAGMLHAWASAPGQGAEARVRYLEGGGFAQPLIAMLHRSVLPEVQTALRGGEYRVMRVYAGVAEALAIPSRAGQDQIVQRAVLLEDGRLIDHGGREIPWVPTPRELLLRDLWCSNLNTPEEFAAAEERWRRTRPEFEHRS
jgi:molybdopterin-guanine dinucleotide biosynthesis protein A